MVNSRMFGPNLPLGVGRPDRSVSVDDARNPESVADARLLAKLMAPSSDEGWLDPSQRASLGTAVEIARPMQLRDLGMTGAAGMVPLPLPGGVAGRGIVKGAGKLGKAIGGTDDFLRALLRSIQGADRGVDATKAGKLRPGRSDFHRDALEGRVRGSSQQNPAAKHRPGEEALFDTLADTENHVGMGRLSNFTEPDIKHWYLLQEAKKRKVSGMSRSFDGMTGERISGAVDANRAVLESLSDEILEAAEAAYRRDAAAYSRMVGE